MMFSQVCFIVRRAFEVRLSLREEYETIRSTKVLKRQNEKY